jgi:hypothetical protein
VGGVAVVAGAVTTTAAAVDPPAQVYSVEVLPDGKTVMTVYTPAEEVGANALADSLRAQGVPGVTVGEPGGVGPPAVCRAGTAR